MSVSIAIVVPTWDNRGQLEPMLDSLLYHPDKSFGSHVYVVNNGKPGSCDFAKEKPYAGRVTIFEPGENLGWEGGLKHAIELTDEPLILFCNDDVLFKRFCPEWLVRMSYLFVNRDVGAAGPLSNVVMGCQNVAAGLGNVSSVRYLIGFCMLVRREALEKAGGIDTSLPGGDDIDLSIRLRKAGYRLMADPSSFVWHHGFGSGRRMHGDYYNSPAMTQATNDALIRKHGFKQWWLAIHQQLI